jgi:hypothetical protein
MVTNMSLPVSPSKMNPGLHPHLHPAFCLHFALILGCEFTCLNTSGRSLRYALYGRWNLLVTYSSMDSSATKK